MVERSNKYEDTHQENVSSKKCSIRFFVTWLNNFHWLILTEKSWFPNSCVWIDEPMYWFVLYHNSNHPQPSKETVWARAGQVSWHHLSSIWMGNTTQNSMLMHWNVALSSKRFSHLSSLPYSCIQSGRCQLNSTSLPRHLLSVTWFRCIHRSHLNL